MLIFDILGTSVRFPQYCNQGIRITIAIPGVSKSGKVRRFDSQGHRTANGVIQFI